MRIRLQRWLVLGACALACAAIAATSLWSPASYVRSEDQNGDGRPDIWHTYNRQGQLSHVAVDTNFDGRADVEEYYEQGALVRRESDRDFNDRIDLVQDFDPTTHEPVRSVVDVDFDGAADLLVLFREGLPVFSKWSHPATPIVAVDLSFAGAATTSPRGATDHLAPFQDPFLADLSVRAVQVSRSAGDSVGVATSSGLPTSCRDLAGPPATSSGLSGSPLCRPASVTVVPYSPRGPPASFPLA